MAGSPGDSDAGPITSVQLDARSVLIGVAGVLALLAASALFSSTRRSTTVLVVGVLLAFAVEPLVHAVQRRLGTGRAAATVVVFGLIVALFTVLVLLVGPAAARQVRELGEQLPETVAQLEDLPLIGDRLASWDVADKAERWIDDLPTRLDPDEVAESVRGAVSGLLNGLGVLVVALVVTLDGPLLVRRLRSLVPEAQRDEADAVGRVFSRVVGTYFAGSLLVATIAGTWVLTVCLVLGIPLAPIAAVWYAVSSLIPQVGGFLGISFVTVLALSEGVPTALLALVLLFAYMEVENYLLGPAIVGDAIDISPPTTMLAAIIGGAAAGVPGALAATPLVGTAKALYLHFRHGDALPVKPTSFRDRIPAPLRKLLRLAPATPST